MRPPTPDWAAVVPTLRCGTNERLGMKRVAETTAVIDRIAAETGVDKYTVMDLVRSIRDVVDELVTDDYSLVAPPLVLAYPTDPVYAALSKRAEAAVEPFDWAALDDRELAEWLRLSPDVVEQHPIATEGDILSRLLERHGLPVDECPESLQALAVMNAWLDTFTPGREYRVGRVGLEKDFEQWLVRNFDRLAPLGYPVELWSGEGRRNGQQHRLTDGRVPDLVCRYTVSDTVFTKGDWLVIENKATCVDDAAIARIRGYVQQVKAELAEGTEEVFGLLLADGASPGSQARLHAQGIGYISLSALGYRRLDERLATHQMRMGRSRAGEPPLWPPHTAA